MQVKYTRGSRYVTSVTYYNMCSQSYIYVTIKMYLHVRQCLPYWIWDIEYEMRRHNPSIVFKLVITPFKIHIQTYS